MTSGVGGNSGIGLLTSIQRGGGRASSVLGGQGAASMLSNSIANIAQINEARQARADERAGRGTFNAARALFGDLSNNLFRTLGSINQARVAQALQSTAPANTDDRERLTQRLSQLSIERLVILENALSEDPEIEIPRALQRSIDGLSDRDKLTFRLAVKDAIDIVAEREANKGASSSGSGSGSLFNVSV